MMIPRLLAFAMLGAAAPLPAAVLVSLEGGYLKDQNGQAITSGSGRMVLVASTGDATFAEITAGSSLSVGGTLTAGGDDVVLFASTVSGDGNNNGADDAGEFAQAISLTLSGALTAGSALALYWFPSLDADSASASAGTAYGFYRADAAGGDGSDAWVVPTDGTIGYELRFLTADAGSSVNGSLGVADRIVAVPEPATLALVAMGTGVFVRRRRKKDLLRQTTRPCPVAKEVSGPAADGLAGIQ